MGDMLRRLRDLGSELKERRVYRAGALYLACAYALLGAADLVFPTLGVPGWIFALLLLVAVCGLPAVVGLSWAFDVTRHGVRRAGGGVLTGATRWGFASLVVTASLAMGLTGWWLWIAPGVEAGSPDRPPPGGPDRARIAVLYFDDNSPSGELGFVADGLTEGLIHQLAGVEGLEVVSRYGVRPFRDRAVPLDSVVRTLGVGSLVEGSVTGTADRLVVTVNLVDASTGAQVASRSFERPIADVLAIQEGLAEEVARELRARLGQEIRVRERRGATSARAWELIRRAESLLDDAAALTRDDGEAASRALERADSLAAEAAALDPRWVDPPLTRAEVARRRAMQDASLPGRGDPRLLGVALRHADDAAARRPEEASPWEVRGSLLTELARSTPAAADSLRVRAEADLRHALDLDPSRAGAWRSLSRLVQEMGRPGEARLAAERALQADAFLEDAADIVHELYFSALNTRDLAEAQRWCLEGRRRFPAAARFVQCRLYLLASPGVEATDPGLAWALADTLVALVSPAGRPTARLLGSVQAAKVLARAGMADSARAVLEAAGGVDTPAWLAYDRAHALLLMGDREGAVAALRRFLEQDPDQREALREDWWLESLRGDPAFEALLAPSGPGG